MENLTETLNDEEYFVSITYKEIIERDRTGPPTERELKLETDLIRAYENISEYGQLIYETARALGWDGDKDEVDVDDEEERAVGLLKNFVKKMGAAKNPATVASIAQEMRKTV